MRYHNDKSTNGGKFPIKERIGNAVGRGRLVRVTN